MKLEYRNEDILNTECPIIIHGCNCFHKMGAGIAKYLANKYPEIEAVDKAFTNIGDVEKLGSYTYTHIDNNRKILNCYTQFHYSSNRVEVDYRAMELVLKKIKRDFPSVDIASPKIGCGLAGGDWKIVEQIFMDVFEDDNRNIIIYYI